jgi:hypothetical protein
MRPVKRLLVFTMEAGVLLLGSVLSVALVFVFAVVFRFDPVDENGFVGVVFLIGLLLTIVGFIAVRSKTRPWKIEYDAVGWTLTQAERKLHPTFARRKRIAKRVLVGMPSLIAAVVLFFYPAAFHLMHPSSQNLGPYRVSIPWTLAILSVPGVHADSEVIAFALLGSGGNSCWTPFWRGELFSSGMIFGSGKGYAGNLDYRVRYAEEMHAEGTQVLRKDLRLNDVRLSCWQYLIPHRWPWAAVTGPLWQVDCETPVGVHGQHFSAFFRGSGTDIPAFYRIIERVVPVA